MILSNHRDSKTVVILVVCRWQTVEMILDAKTALAVLIIALELEEIFMGDKGSTWKKVYIGKY